MSSEIRREKLSGLIRVEGESATGYTRRVGDYLEYVIRGPLGVHFVWYTHKNTAGCWICDLVQCCTVLLSEMRRYAEMEESDIAGRGVLDTESSGASAKKGKQEAINNPSPHFKSNNNSKKEVKRKRRK